MVISLSRKNSFRTEEGRRDTETTLVRIVQTVYKMKRFAKIANRFQPQNAPSQMFDTVLNTPLIIFISKENSKGYLSYTVLCKIYPKAKYIKRIRKMLFLKSPSCSFSLPLLIFLQFFQIVVIYGAKKKTFESETFQGTIFRLKSLY